MSPIRVGTDHGKPVSVVRNLGIYVHADVSMRSHVRKTIAVCFAILHQLRSVRRSILRPHATGNAVFFRQEMQRLQYPFPPRLEDAVGGCFPCCCKETKTAAKVIAARSVHTGFRSTVSFVLEVINYLSNVNCQADGAAERGVRFCQLVGWLADDHQTDGKRQWCGGRVSSSSSRPAPHLHRVAATE